MKFFLFLLMLLSSWHWSYASKCFPVNDSQGNYTISCPNYVDNPNLYDNDYKNKKRQSRH